jgi:hypothetical protein
MSETEEERIIHRLVRHYDMKSGVTNEFASALSAKHEWKRRLKEAGYKPGRNGEWHKPGCPVIMDPY